MAEYFESRNLQVVVEQDGPLPYVRAADYIRQAAEDLDHIHHAGLIIAISSPRICSSIPVMS